MKLDSVTNIREGFLVGSSLRMTALKGRAFGIVAVFVFLYDNGINKRWHGS